MDLSPLFPRLPGRHCTIACAMLLAGLGASAVRGATPDDLKTGFVSPPDSAKPTVFWHWLDDNVSKEGITADLEEMKRVGLGGALIASADCQVPLGNVKFGSDAWYDMILHSAKEADRLNLRLESYIAAGWAAAGGPWVDPAHAMMRVTSSEQQVRGGTHFDAILPQPRNNLNYYRDIAVLAFPTPPADEVKMSQFSPTVTSSDPGLDVEKITDGDPTTASTMVTPSPGKSHYIQFEFAQPFPVRSFTITAGGLGMMGVGGELQSSGDGIKYSTRHGFWMDRGKDPQSWSVPATSARFYRLVFNKGPLGYNGAPPPPGMTIAEVSLQPKLAIINLVGKTDIIRNDWMGAPNLDPAEPDQVIDPSKIVDLTPKLQPDGRLTWDVPAGAWTLYRVGYTPTGAKNSPATPEATGLEVDKLSTEATDFFWAAMPRKMIDRLGPLAGTTFNRIFVDSWEAGSQNWTPAFAAEFKKRRGYDITPYLPVFAGHVVGSPDITERFLWDLRRTIADMLADNFFGRLAQLCHQSNLQFSVEPYGDGPFEDLEAARDADLVRGEFWPGRLFKDEPSPKLASSIVHTYGKTVVGAESFTDFLGRWESTPEKLKSLGDLVLTLGINHYTLHEYAHQPWPNRRPGMTMGPWGTNFNRAVTWSEQGKSWISYLTRCCYLLQQGRFVADVLYFNGEKAPASVGEDKSAPLVLGRHEGAMGLPAGYDYDDCDVDVVLHRLSVKDGRLVLPNGMSYRALVLPQTDAMTPELMHKLQELVADGATIYGPKPERSPSLVNYPQCDQDVKSAASALWDSGKINDPKSMTAILSTLNLKPDFSYADKTARLLYIHRKIDGGDLYFVSNQNGAFTDTDCSFRVSGEIPELWHPDTGMIEKAPLYSEENGLTRLPLYFDPVGSIFVVFHDKPSGATDDHAIVLSGAGNASPAAAPSDLRITKATYEAVDNKRAEIDITGLVASLVQKGGLSMMVDPDLIGKDPLPHHDKQLRVDYTWNGTPGERIAQQRETFTLGSATPTAHFPDAELLVAPDQSLKLQAWRPGTYKVTTNSGKQLQAVVAHIPDPVTVPGSWDLTFPPNWGAPDKVSLDHLISWTDHPEPGVKYFSGTATYHKTLTVPAEMIAAGHRLYLDLGDVQNLAQVRLNGQDLGVLWKRPFCVEITDAAKAGDNALEVQVTNLWANRLIGDDFLPPDCEWVGKALKQWPDWLLQGKPSPTGRLTFTTWRQWTKDDAPFPSGLLGPVTLMPSVVVSPQ